MQLDQKKAGFYEDDSTDFDEGILKSAPLPDYISPRGSEESLHVCCSGRSCSEEEAGGGREESIKE